MKINVVSFILHLIVFTSISYSQNKDTLFITADSLSSTEFYLGRWDKADWYYKSGDDPSWALPEYNHSDWDTVNSFLQIGKFDQNCKISKTQDGGDRHLGFSEILIASMWI